MKFKIKLGLILLSLTSLTFASTEDIVKKQQEIEAKLDSIKVKEGIEIGGQFKSEYIRSEIKGEAANDTLRTREDIGYTQVDFDFKARPNTSTTARAIMRMHADWPTFFGSLGNPITTRWISLDGKIGDFTWYHVGDYKAKWSEYSIWSDNSELLYEPYIFTEQREQQMGEAFLGDNYRPVQGVNLKTAMKIGPLDYLAVDLLGARLRTAFMPKLDAGAPVATASSLVASSFESGEMDKYLMGGKLDLEAYNVGVFATYNTTVESELTSKYRVTAPLTTTNMSFGGNIAIEKMLDMPALLLQPKGEFAMSNYKINTEDGLTPHAGFMGDTEGDNTGNAMTVGALLGYEVSKSFNAKLDFGYVNNSSTYRNDMAQSPEFIPQQIMNVDNNNLVNEKYTYFDARYRGAYKSVTKIPLADGTMDYKAYPTSKLSYTNMIITAEESGALMAQTAQDANHQPFTPFAYGASTPNLTGIKLNADFGVLDNKVEVSGYFSNMNEIDGYNNEMTMTNEEGEESSMTYNWNTAKFANFGGGLNLHLGKLLSFNRAIQLSGAFEAATATRDAGTIEDTDGDNGDNMDNGSMDLTSNMINVGLYVNIIPRLSLLGGLQMFNNQEVTKYNHVENPAGIIFMDYKDTQVLGGLEYKVNAGAYLLVEGGFIKHENLQDDAFAALGEAKTSFEQMPIIMTKIKVNF